jgi:hypothetical protein
MRRYRARRKAAGLKTVTRWEPAGVHAIGSHFSDHRILEARSLALHCRIALKITADRSLLETARRNLQRWSSGVKTNRPRYLREWQRLLAAPWPQVAALITEQSERAARLRQSSPFAGVLTAAERREVYDAFRA